MLAIIPLGTRGSPSGFSGKCLRRARTNATPAHLCPICTGPSCADCSVLFFFLAPISHPQHCFPPHRIASYTAEIHPPCTFPNPTYTAANMPKKFPTIVSPQPPRSIPTHPLHSPLDPACRVLPGPERDHAGCEPDGLVDDNNTPMVAPAQTSPSKCATLTAPRSSSRRSSPLPTGRGVTTTVKPLSTGVSRAQRNHKRSHEVSDSCHLLTSPL
jgi:hypothetical protein